MNLIQSGQQLTMSSQEIADLVESRHDSVKRTIERLIERKAIGLTPLVEVKNGQGQTVSVYQLEKRPRHHTGEAGMTASTEQERTEFPSPALLKKLQTSTEGGAILVDDYAGGYDLLTEIWRVIVADEAARRAPAVPAPQGWKLVPVEPTQEVLDAIDLMADDHRAFDDSDSFWRHLVAAAPQPPEAAQLDDIGVVDMAQAVDSKEAAPVQLPDCAGIYTVEPDDFDDDNCVTWRGGMPPARGTKLYTEHQVRQLLAARGIEEPQ